MSTLNIYFIEKYEKIFYRYPLIWRYVACVVAHDAPTGLGRNFNNIDQSTSVCEELK